MRARRLRIAVMGLVATTACFVVACGGRLERPPVEVLQRPSLIGAGTIVQIKSTTNEPLTDLEITISSPDRELTHREAALGGYEMIELGWKKLGGWQVPENAEIEVRAAGYLLPVRARLTPADEGEQPR